VLGRFNLVDLEDGTAELGYRVAQQVAGRGVATATVQELCRLAAARYGLRTLRAATTYATSRPRRYWPKPGSSRLARPSPAADQAPGISVTWPPTDPRSVADDRSPARSSESRAIKLRL